MIPSCLCNCVSGVLGSGLCNDAIKFLSGSLFTRLGYLVHPKMKAEKLEKATEDLKTKRNDIKRKTNAAEKNREIVDDEVSAWLKKVHDIEEEVGTISEEVKDIKTCFKGCCPNLVGRYKIGKRISKKSNAVAHLQISGVFDKVSQPPIPLGFQSMPMGDIMCFTSTKEAMDQVSEAMQNDIQQVIGIYGMGGVGKTTIMDELGRKFCEDNKYGTVIKVIVSQNPDIVQIRRNIASDLGMMTFWAGGENAAGELASRLKKEKIVIMMDDIWNRLDLRSIGIPIGEHKGCKILFTTRTLEACQQMECHASIEVKVLTEEDSWTLFESKVGDVCNKPDVKPTANKVAKECGGLPLALVVLGRAMRGHKQLSFWESALVQLKQSSCEELPGVEAHLYNSLKLSYNYITNVEMRLLFLFCCLFREDYEISEEELTRYAAGEGFLKNTNTLDGTRKKVHLLMENLISSCLLIRSEEDRCITCVKMHDVVRDVAVNIASKGDDHFYVKAGLDMKDWPAESEPFETFKRISLMTNDITALTDQPNCSKLVTLLLNNNPSLSVISTDFFNTMTSLTVLDLSDTNIELLPTSLASLTNLGLLRLDRCKKLREISIIGKLSKLKLLGLQKCKVEVFPREIECLTNLKLLDISFASFRLIPPDLISKLYRLEELLMKGYDSKALISSVGFLGRLVHLQMLVSDPNCFSQDVIALEGWMNLNRFKVLNSFDSSEAFISDKFLSLKDVTKLGNWTKRLFSEAESLMLDSCLWEAADSGTLVNVKKLRLTNCSNIDSLLNTALFDISLSNVFAKLESLIIGNLENMRKICLGEVPSESFKKLKWLEVIRCNKLDSLIPCNLLQKIHHNLTFLTVNDCHRLNEIFNSEGLSENNALFPILEKVSLFSLSNLTRLWNGTVPKGSLQKLCSLRILGKPNKLEILFSNTFPVGTFANLKELEVVNCPLLKHLFTPSLVGELQNLEKMIVKRNGLMEVIIGHEDNVEIKERVFQRLKVMEFVHLPELKNFCSGVSKSEYFDWPQLEALKFESCKNMDWIPFGVNSAPKLKKINVDDINWFNKLKWEDSNIASRFEICKNI